MLKWLWLLLAFLAVAGGLWWANRLLTAREDPARTVEVRRGTIVAKAVAVGRIEPELEVPVKSSSGGIVTEVFVAVGQKVRAGAPLAEVRPEVTALTLVEAERALRAAQDAEENAREFLEGAHPLATIMRLLQGRPALERMHRAARLQRRRAEERLALLKQGQVEAGQREIDYVVRAPAAGHVLQILAREGHPVVPRSSFGSGTVLMTLADMDHPVFRGTVDEIDVGALAAGMTAEVRVGALPGKTLAGRLTEISLKAERRDNAVVFAVRLDVKPDPAVVLRSGYSAVAEVELARREDVLVLPERVVEFRGGEAWVRVPGGDGPRARRIATGAGDGLLLEVRSGLEEGARVLERSYSLVR